MSAALGGRTALAALTTTPAVGSSAQAAETAGRIAGATEAQQSHCAHSLQSGQAVAPIV